MDSCANLVALGRKLPSHIQPSGFHKINTSNGPTGAPSAIVSGTPLGKSTDVCFLENGSNVIGTNILTENSAGFIHVGEDLAKTFQLPSGPHVLTISKNGNKVVIPCKIKGGKPSISLAEIEDAKKEAERGSSTKGMNR